jgi:hypothetical protein
MVRALEALKAIIVAPAEVENPLQLLAGTSFAYSETKGGPANMVLDLILGSDEASGLPIVGRFTFVADREKVFEESFYHIIGRSKKLMYERKLIDGDAETPRTAIVVASCSGAKRNGYFPRSPRNNST